MAVGTNGFDRGGKSSASGTWLANALLSAAALLLAFAMLEGGLLVWSGFNGTTKAGTGIYRYEDFYVSSRPIAVFDRVSGYRRLPGPVRIARIMRDELVF